MAISTVGSTFTQAGSGLVGELTSIAFSGISCAEIDTSNLSKQVKSFVLGTQDGGTVTATCNFTTAPDMPVAGDSTTAAFVVVLGASGSAVTVSFSGYISSLAIETGIDAVISATYVVQTTGAVTIS